jgi:hypothetical protein
MRPAALVTVGYACSTSTRSVLKAGELAIVAKTADRSYGCCTILVEVLGTLQR